MFMYLLLFVRQVFKTFKVTWLSRSIMNYQICRWCPWPWDCEPWAAWEWARCCWGGSRGTSAAPRTCPWPAASELSKKMVSRTNQPGSVKNGDQRLGYRQHSDLRAVICWRLPKSSQQFTIVRCKSINITSAFYFVKCYQLLYYNYRKQTNYEFLSI